jgi:hypothetical protein
MSSVTNWIVPNGGMLPQVMSLDLLVHTNENIDANSLLAAESGPVPGNRPIDPTLEDRGDDLVSQLVAQVRESIQVAGRFPLSVTAGAVPPKAVRHILNIAAWQLINSDATLRQVIMTEKGAYAPFEKYYEEGLKYIDYLTRGGGIVPPSDPTGIDYVNPVSQNANPPVSAIFSFPLVTELDLSTDNAPGGRTHGGTNPPNGVQWGNIGDIYRQVDTNGHVIKIWEKIWGWGNEIGWE